MQAYSGFANITRVRNRHEWKSERERLRGRKDSLHMSHNNRDFVFLLFIYHTLRLKHSHDCFAPKLQGKNERWGGWGMKITVESTAFKE